MKNKILHGFDSNKRKIEVEISEGKIIKVSPSHKNDLKYFIIPGFIDIHTHGGYGFDWTEVDIEKAKVFLHSVAKLEGCTSLLGTLITTKKEILRKAIIENKKLIDKNLKGANLIGFHLEGPFLNPLKKGAHPVEELELLTHDSLNYFIKDNQGAIKLMTYAPELVGPEGTKLIVEYGIIPSIGHTMANEDEAKEAILYGAKSVTHFNNAMMKIDSTENSFALFAIKSNDVYIEFINDGIHNSYELAERIFKEKPEDKLILITDSLSLKGLEDGIYKGPNLDMHKRDGAIFTPTGVLNGSSYSMIQAFRDWINKIGSSMEQAVKVTSTNAAKLLNLNKGKIQEGMDADILVLDENLNIVEVFVNGIKIE